MTNQVTLGFIGLGLMGTPMSQRLLAAGYQLTVWNRTIKKCDSLKTQGAIVAGSIAELVKQSDIVMTCLTDTDAVEAVVFSDEFLEHSNEKKLLLDFSSIDPEKTKKFAQRLHESCGMAWVDSPVSGGVAGAESGNLVAMTGGEADNIERVRPVLSHLSQRLTHMGDVEYAIK